MSKPLKRFFAYAKTPLGTRKFVLGFSIIILMLATLLLLICIVLLKKDGQYIMLNLVKGNELVFHFVLAEEYVMNFLIFLAVLIFLFGVIGAIGIVKEHNLLIICYGFLVLLVFVPQFWVGVTRIVLSMFRVKKERMLYAKFTNSYLSYHNSTEVRRFIDTVQINFQCCGPYGPKNWKVKILPQSCYKVHKLFHAGCRKKLIDFMSQRKIFIGISNFTVGFSAFISGVLALRFRRFLKNYYATEYD